MSSQLNAFQPSPLSVGQYVNESRKRLPIGVSDEAYLSYPIDHILYRSLFGSQEGLVGEGVVKRELDEQLAGHGGSVKETVETFTAGAPIWTGYRSDSALLSNSVTLPVCHTAYANVMTPYLAQDLPHYSPYVCNTVTFASPLETCMPLNGSHTSAIDPLPITSESELGLPPLFSPAPTMEGMPLDPSAWLFSTLPPEYLAAVHSGSIPFPSPPLTPKAMSDYFPSVDTSQRLGNEQANVKVSKVNEQNAFAKGKQLSKPQKVFPCLYPGCDRTFTRLFNLQTHTKTHTGLGYFECEYCDFKFARKHDLTRHTRLHTDEKPYVCGACGAGYTRSDALGRHVRRGNCVKK